MFAKLFRSTSMIRKGSSDRWGVPAIQQSGIWTRTTNDINLLSETKYEKWHRYKFPRFRAEAYFTVAVIAVKPALRCANSAGLGAGRVGHSRFARKTSSGHSRGFLCFPLPNSHCCELKSERNGLIETKLQTHFSKPSVFRCVDRSPHDADRQRLKAKLRNARHLTPFPALPIVCRNKFERAKACDVHTVLQLDPRDNVLVALKPLRKGESVSFSGADYTLLSDIPAKHKFVTKDLSAGDRIIMYGGLVGTMNEGLRRGDLLSTRNLRHAASDYHSSDAKQKWTAPDVSAWRDRTFLGYHRADGQVGTRNHWLVIPLVFCENRNLGVLKQAFEEELGFAPPQVYRRQVAEMVKLFREGKAADLKDFRPGGDGGGGFGGEHRAEGFQKYRRH